MQTATPTPQLNIHYMLGELMERTKGLPEMRDTVTRTEQRVAALEDKFDAHDAEMRRLRGATSKARRGLAFVRGEWKTVVLAVGLVVDHFWKGVH